MSGEEFVTVVSVEDAPLVTVVQVQEPPTVNRPTSTEPPIVQEDVRIYRLPGERLGFGLKFQGCPSVSALTIESTSEGSPSARATASWGPLAPGDRILAVDGRPVTGMTRQQVVGCLTESGLVVTLRVRRGPPPVPPRRQVKRRPVGPPPPPRPLPRAPPRLVRIVPKQNSPRPILIEPRHSDTLKSENVNKIQINGSQPLYLTMDDDGLSQVDPINFDENLKEKICPLKNLNPKLISLFEHSQPCEINLKTSQNIQCNNELWTHGKSRKSVKDKIALFSCDSENDENRSSEMDNDGLYLNEKQSRKVLKKVQTSISVPEKDVTSNKQYLCSKINISENGGLNNVDVTSEQDQIYLDSKINFSSNDPIENRGKSETNKNDSSIIDPVQKINPTLKHSNEDALALQHTLPKVDVKSSSLFNTTSERRVKMSTYKDKCGSKLRGLIIPNPSRVTSDQQILDLPEIKSSTLISNGNEVTFQNDDDFQNNYQKQDCETLARNLSNKVTVPTGIEWKPKFDNEIPKYSPAFKRKSLSVFEIRTHSTDAHLVNDNNSKLPQLQNYGGNKLDQEQPIKISTDLQTEPPDGERKNNSNFQFIEKSNSKSNDKVISQALEETLTSDNYFESCENLSAPSSINSELTVYNYYSLNSNDDTDENREFTDCKLDSLLSHDLCDSGNHSVPSNSSKKYKCDSYDESMSSLINERIQDSEDTSLNLSSDDGRFTEINYKDENDQNETNDDGRNFVYNKTYKLEESNSYQQCEYLSRERKETTNETLQCYESDVKNSTSPYKCKEQPTNHTYEKNRSTEERHIPEMLLCKFNNADKFKQSIPSSRQDDLKANHDAILRDHISISEDSVSSFSSPLSDLQKDNHFASITSLASSTSLISHQELCQLIEESNDASIDDSNGSPEISVIVLHRDIAEGSIGITLAGGVDYESKEITVHKVLAGSPADRDGRIKKGNRILSINGKSMKNLTHAESMAVLKTPRHEVVLVVVRSQGELFEENNNVTSSCYPIHSPLSDSSTHTPSSTGNDFNWGPVVTVVISKEGAGLGFSLKGGKDSPSGDQPLTIQKIFTGGCAEKSKQIFAGDELLQVNQYDLKGMTRVEAWTLMKKLPDGDISLKIRHPTQST